MVLPKNLKVCNSSFVEDTNHLVSSSVVTICNMEFIDRYFPKEVVYSHDAKVSSSAVKVRKELKERYKIPRLDPVIDPNWNMEEKTSLESMAYLTSIFLDIIPKNLTSVWSKIIKRNVL